MSKKGLFKGLKKTKKSDDDTVKVPMKKSTVIIIEVITVILIVAIAIGIKYLVTNKVDTSTVKLDNQEINHVTFSDFSIKYKDEESNIKVNLINYSVEDVTINNIVIKLYAKDNTQVSEITVDYLDQNGGPLVLGPNQNNVIENNTKLDLTNVTKVEYELK